MIVYAVLTGAVRHTWTGCFRVSSARSPIRRARSKKADQENKCSLFLLVPSCASSLPHPLQPSRPAARVPRQWEPSLRSIRSSERERERERESEDGRGTGSGCGMWVLALVRGQRNDEHEYITGIWLSMCSSVLVHEGSLVCCPGRSLIGASCHPTLSIDVPASPFIVHRSSFTLLAARCSFHRYQIPTRWFTFARAHP